MQIMDNLYGPKARDMAKHDLGAQEHKWLEGEGQASHGCEVQCSLKCRCRGGQEGRQQGLLHPARGVASPGQGCTLRVDPQPGLVK